MKINSFLRPFLYVVGSIATLLMLLLIFTKVSNYLQNGALFQVQKIIIVTKGRADEKELISLADIKLGTNIFYIDLAEVKERIETHPWVKFASVSRSLPNTIIITYSSQEPKAILNLKGLYYVNADGKAFYKLQKGDSLRYPYISVDGFANSLKDITRERVHMALQLLDWSQASSIFSSADIGDVSLKGNLYKGTTPLRMTVAYPPQKMRREKHKQWSYIDVSFAENDVMRQIRRAEKITEYLNRENIQPMGIRLELGKKVIVKIR